MTSASVQTSTITQSGEARAPIETTSDRRRHARVAVVAASVALLLSACSTTMSGMGYGNRAHAGKFTEPVQMSWTSDNDPRSGTMTATLPDRTYSGPFFEITQQTREDSLTSLWNGWGKGWLDWSYWTSTPDEEYSVSHFVTQYTGKVVANLSAADGSGMRCRFHLMNPASGMAGGGAGECQIKGSETIQARF